MDHDRLGRRRLPEQHKGLRPLHPLLPTRWTSKAIRVAMSEGDWARFDALLQEGVSSEQALSQARANGEVISKLMEAAADAVAEQTPAPARLDWMDWERQKTLRLLRAAV